MISARNFFNKTIKHDLILHEKLQGDDYTTEFFLDYPYFKEYYK